MPGFQAAYARKNNFGIGEHLGSQLAASIAIDAGLIHEEVARDVFRDGAAPISHIFIVAR